MRKALIAAATAAIAIAVALAPGASLKTLAEPSEFTDGNATYTLTDDASAVILTGWDPADTSEEITLSETATDGTETYDVIGIGDNVFSGISTLKTITIPATIASIGDGALAGENLTTVNMQSSAAPSIGTDVFNASATVNVPAESTGYDAEAWTAVNVVPATSDDGDTTDPATDPTDPSESDDTTKPEVTGTVADFVERLYTVALGRPSDPLGKADWVDRAEKQGYTGADLAHGFLFSPEFLDKNLETSDFLDILYRTFFDREADKDGKDDWTGRMADGWTKQDVINGFIGSDEWAALCASYGIESGRDQISSDGSSDKITAFAARLYSTCLGRTPDANGLADWANKLRSQTVTGTEVARGFFFSPEFLDAHYSDGEFVTRLYRTFLGRTPDTAGFNDWVGRLADGATREDVFYGFANSVEFDLICKDYGILR